MTKDGAVFLSAGNAADMLSCKHRAYMFSDKGPGGRDEGFYVRDAPFNAVSAFQDASERYSENSSARLKELCKLIAQSVVDPDGTPIWNELQIDELRKSCTRRFLDMQRAVVHHNGLTMSDDKVRQLLDEAGND